MTLLDRGTWNASTWTTPPEPVIHVALPLASRSVEPPADAPRDDPEPAALPSFCAARLVPRADLDALLADAGRAPESIIRELGDRLVVPGWDGVSDVSFSRPPWFSSLAPDASVLHVPGAAPVPGRPFSVFEAFWRACAALRRQRGTLTRRDERELAVRLILFFTTLRETHA